MLLALAAFAAGSLTAIQIPVNDAMRRVTGRPLGTALISFAVGTVALLVAGLARGELSVRAAEPGALPWWAWIGGFLGAVSVTCVVFLAPRLGVVALFGLVITGQMLASVTLDQFGLLGLDARPISVGRALGVALILGAIALVSRAARRSPGIPGLSTPPVSRGFSDLALLGVGIGLLSGSMLPIQAAVNARLQTGVGSPLLAALISFSVGTLALILAHPLLRQPFPDPRHAITAPWWAWLGGVLGAFYVASVIVFLPRLGAAATVGLVVAGQNATSLAIDHFGLIRLPRRPASPVRLGGVVALLVGVLLIQFL